MLRPTVLRTIDDIRRTRFEVWAECQNIDCLRGAKLDLHVLSTISIRGRPGSEATLLDLNDALRCSACGSGDVRTHFAGG